MSPWRRLSLILHLRFEHTRRLFWGQGGFCAKAMELEASREHWSFTQLWTNFLCKTCLDNFYKFVKLQLFCPAICTTQLFLKRCLMWESAQQFHCLMCKTAQQFYCFTVSQEMFDGDECSGTGSQSASVELFFDSTRLKLIGFGVKHWNLGHILVESFFILQIRLNFLASGNWVFAYFWKILRLWMVGWED